MRKGLVNIFKLSTRIHFLNFSPNEDQQLNEKIHSQHHTRRALHEFWLSRGSIPVPEMALQRFVDG